MDQTCKKRDSFSFAGNLRRISLHWRRYLQRQVAVPLNKKGSAKMGTCVSTFLAYWSEGKLHIPHWIPRPKAFKYRHRIEGTFKFTLYILLVIPLHAHQQSAQLCLIRSARRPPCCRGCRESLQQVEAGAVVLTASRCSTLFACRGRSQRLQSKFYLSMPWSRGTASCGRSLQFNVLFSLRGWRCPVDDLNQPLKWPVGLRLRTVYVDEDVGHVPWDYLSNFGSSFAFLCTPLTAPPLVDLLFSVLLSSQDCPLRTSLLHTWSNLFYSNAVIMQRKNFVMLRPWRRIQQRLRQSHACTGRLEELQEAEKLRAYLEAWL